jgi:hypothetical protein
MTRLLPLQGLIKNMAGEISKNNMRVYMPKEKAYELLKEWTGQDFGQDIEAWKNWVEKHPDIISK